MWIRNIFTFSQSLFPATLPPSCPQKPLESRQNLPRDVRRPATDRLIRNSNVKYWKRFLGEILSLETGGMGGGGRSGSRQRGGWNPGPLPSSHGQERLFQRFSGNQVLTQGGYLVVSMGYFLVVSHSGYFTESRDIALWLQPWAKEAFTTYLKNPSWLER